MINEPNATIKVKRNVQEKVDEQLEDKKKFPHEDSGQFAPDTH